MPRDLFDRYSENSYLVNYRKVSPKDYYARCYACSRRGLLYVDLKFYWYPLVRNLLCKPCRESMTKKEVAAREHSAKILHLRNWERRTAKLLAGRKVGFW